MDALIKLVDDEVERCDGPPPSPRSYVANTLASLPEPVNPAEVARAVLATPSLFTNATLEKFAKKQKFCKDEWDENLEIETPGALDRIYQAKPVESPTPHFFYLFHYVLKDVGIRLPFSPFICECLTAAKVAPSQLQPNAWAFMRCFELLLEYLGLEPTSSLFFTIYTMDFNMQVLHNFVSFGARKGLSLFLPFRSNWKLTKWYYFKVVDTPDFPHLMKFKNGRAKFPFYWVNRPTHMIGYDEAVLTERERMALDLLYCLIPKPLSSKLLIQAAIDGSVNEFFRKYLFPCKLNYNIMLFAINFVF